MSAGRAIVVLAAVLPFAAACGERAPEGPPPNVLLVTIDTCRADALKAYGNDRAINTTLDRLEREGIVFERAAAVAPVTLPSHASILTGLYPPSHGALDNVDYVLPPGVPTLAEHLGAHGFATAATVAAYVLAPGTGLDRGFEVYDAPAAEIAESAGAELAAEPIVERDAVTLTNRALALLKGPPAEPFFLWLHYFDPHADYEPPEPWASRAANRYEGEIAHVDAQLGRIVSLLESQARLDRTLVIVTADHGESLGEHDEPTHGLFVYESTIHVPLIVRPPWPILGGRRSDRVVSGVDLVPTVLEMTGLPPIEAIDGVSFAPTIRGEPQPPRGPVYAEARMPELAYGWAPLRALRDGDTKLIDAPRPELYDLALDPDETVDLAPAKPAETNDALRALAALREAMPAPPAGSLDPADAERRERLASLGYLSAGGPAAGADATHRTARPAPDDTDPKDRTELHAALLDAQSLSLAGRHAEALERVSEVVRRDPTNPAALSLEGTLLCRAGRCDDGLARLIDAARAQPRDYETLHNLANALDLAGRPREALDTYRAAIAVRPDAALDHFGLGRLLYRGGDLEGAIAAFDRALELGLDAPRLLAARGIALSKTERVDDATRSLIAAVDADPSRVDAWNALGILAEKRGRPADAFDFYDRALDADPAYADALFNRARLAFQSRRIDEAQASIETLMAARPDYPAARFIDAQIALARGEHDRARRSLDAFLEGPPEPDPRLVRSAREQLSQLDAGGTGR